MSYIKRTVCAVVGLILGKWQSSLRLEWNIAILLLDFELET